MSEKYITIKVRVEDHKVLKIKAAENGVSMMEMFSNCLIGAWKPIETAPKDGTWIMAHDPEMNETCRRMFYCPSGWKDSDYDSICENNPTHWMPLPGPPTTRHGSRDGK